MDNYDQEIGYKALGKRLRDSDTESTESDKDLSPGLSRKAMALGDQTSMAPEFMEVIGKVRQNLEST